VEWGRVRRCDLLSEPRCGTARGGTLIREATGRRTNGNAPAGVGDLGKVNGIELSWKTEMGDHAERSSYQSPWLRGGQT
jgi:hypothetical protein